jgi:hypothetical protein
MTIFLGFDFVGGLFVTLPPLVTMLLFPGAGMPPVAEVAVLVVSPSHTPATVCGRRIDDTLSPAISAAASAPKNRPTDEIVICCILDCNAPDA